MPTFYDDCAACGHPEDGHGTRYAAGVGDHTYVPEIWAGSVDTDVDQPAPTRAIYRAPDGGLAMQTDPSQPVPGGGDKLPPRRTTTT